MKTTYHRAGGNFDKWFAVDKARAAYTRAAPLELDIRQHLILAALMQMWALIFIGRALTNAAKRAGLFFAWNWGIIATFALGIGAALIAWIRP